MARFDLHQAPTLFTCTAAKSHGTHPFQLSFNTVIAEISVCLNVSHSSVREFSHATNFHTAMEVSHTLIYVHGFRMLLIFILSAKSTKYTKFNLCTKISAITVDAKVQ